MEGVNVSDKVTEPSKFIKNLDMTLANDGRSFWDMESMPKRVSLTP